MRRIFTKLSFQALNLTSLLVVLSLFWVEGADEIIRPFLIIPVAGLTAAFFHVGRVY